MTHERFEHAGLTVSIFQDEDAQSPKDSSDDHEREVLFIVTTRNRYFEVLHENYTLDDIRAGKHDKTHWAFRLLAYIHSGVALSLSSSYPFSDPWDSGQIGYVLVSKKAEPGLRFRKKAEALAKVLVENWNIFLSGDVWCYSIERTDEDGELEHVDSCCGFYTLDYCREEAKERAEDIAARETEEAQKSERMIHT